MNAKRIGMCVTACVAAVLFAGAAAVYAQDEQSTGAKQDNSQGSSQGNNENFFGEGSAVAPAEGDASKTSVVQNAVLEGIQLSSEAGKESTDKTVNGYFIFRDKPSSYFYEAKPRENKIVFEFNDAQVGVSPVASMQEKPIQGFRIEPTKVDVNATVKGLKPEWHDVIRVTFYMDAVPEIAVKDEYSVISFTFPWSSDPGKQKQLVVVDESKKTKTVLFSIGGGVGLAAAAGVVWYFLQPKSQPEPTADLSITDLPQHPAPHTP
jgi:hypothetical protein